MNNEAILLEKIKSLEKQVSELLVIVALQSERIKELELRKNSNNSSIPPSKDENRPKPNQSLRAKSGKKSGGQVGHKGTTLEMSATPTSIIMVQPFFCKECGNDLANTVGTISEKRQVIDIPPIVPIISEYQLVKKQCACGYCNEESFPEGVNAPVQYGSSIESMIAYMNVRQYMPFNRIKEYFTQVFNLPISEGTIQNILKRMVEKTTPFYEEIYNAITKESILGGDETSCRINGKKGWFWTLQNTKYTFIHCSDNRGYSTLSNLFPLGLSNTIVNHDAYSAWFKLPTKGHQLCLAHLQRDLNYHLDIEPSKWVKDVKNLFYEAIESKLTQKNTKQYFELKLEKLLNNPPDKPYKKLNAFIKRLIKYKDSLFNFFDHHLLTPDNNGSERAIRNVKVKVKISGQFKTIENATIFATLRTVIGTLIKNNKPILLSLNKIAYKLT